MGEGDKRSQRRTAQHGATPAGISERPGAAETAGDGTEPPVESEAPRMPRTTTLDDPLTTSLLAEVARRSRTIDVSPDQIAEAEDIEPADPAATDEPSPRNAAPGPTVDPDEAATLLPRFPRAKDSPRSPHPAIDPSPSPGDPAKPRTR